MEPTQQVERAQGEYAIKNRYRHDVYLSDRCAVSSSFSVAVCVFPDVIDTGG